MKVQSPFLLITPGARANGMGEAFVAIANDATATYWNPAGLAFLSKREISLMHSNWLPQLASDLFFDYGSIVYPMEGLGTFGLAVTYLNLGTQIITGEDSPEPLGEFSSNEFAIAASFGSKLSKNLALGLSLKYIRSNLASVGAGAEKGDGRANAFAFDLGLLRQNLFVNGLSFGLNLTNMGPKVVYIDASQADPLPTNLRLGFAYKLLDQEFNKITVAVEFDKLLVRKYQDGTSDAWYKALITSWTDEDFNTEMKRVITNVGLEYWYSNIIALRTGYHYDEIGKVKYFTFGAGLKYSLYQLDFGYISAGEGHPLSDTMRFSLAIGF
ncbi:MAG: PorV/PorQ family protein [candidate division KSB1 bacterium]|nr:PorV/PorQ family protein [candidate division KSB1 bacterium]